MKLRSLLFAVAGSLCLATGAHAAVTVDAVDDLYNVIPNGFGGSAPVAIDVTGFSSITFSVSSGNSVTLNSYANFNDADGVGAYPTTSSNTGGNGISGMTAPNAGYLAGAFESATLGATPASLDFTAPRGTSFTSLAPSLQQSFFIGDGLTGDASGTTQTFYVPAGATTLYLGISDACNYNGTPGCYFDNAGSFDATVTGTSVSGAVPEPASWALMLTGLGIVGFTMRKQSANRSQRMILPETFSQNRRA